MSDEILGRMVYSFLQPMWHAITEPSQVAMNAVQVMMERFNGGHEIFQRPVTVMLNGQPTETGDFAVVRGASEDVPEEAVLAYCTERYHPLQPMDVARTFDEKINQPVETMAFLRNGREQFITWEMPGFSIAESDTHSLYGVVRVGFDTLKGAGLYTSIVRHVCMNTAVMGEQWAKQNADGHLRGKIWTGKASNVNLLEHLGYWMAHVQRQAIEEAELIKSFMFSLAKTPIKSEVEAHEILWEAYPSMSDTSAYFPPELRSAKADKVAEYNAGQESLRDGIYSLFAGNGTAITPDYYGMFNATTEFFCHYQPSKKPIAESVMFGGRQANTMQMVKTLAERIR